MILEAHTFAYPQTRKKAAAALAKGQEVTVVHGAEHDENVLAKIVRSPEFQRDIKLGRSVRVVQADPTIVGAAVGGVIGATAGVVVDHLTQTHPAARLLGKIALAALGAVVGREVAKEKYALHVTYDPQTGGLVSRLKR